MMSRAVDYRLQYFGDSIVAVMYRYRPYVDYDVESEVDDFMNWEQKNIDMIW